MIDGHNLLQISKVASIPGQRRDIMIEVLHHDVTLRRYLPAGRLADGGVRPYDILQFWAKDGGLRTIAVDDLVIL